MEGKYEQDEAGCLLLEGVVREFEHLLYSNRRGRLYRSVLAKIEKPLIENALERFEGNQSQVARILGINRNTLKSKMKEHGI